MPDDLPPGVTTADLNNHDGERQCDGCGHWFRPGETDQTHCARCQHADDQNE